MRRRTLLLGLILPGWISPFRVHAASPATPDEAKALVEKAAAHLAAVGPDKAIADFNDPAAGYIDRELFVVVYGPDGKILSCYGVPVLRGKDAASLKDVEGRPFGEQIIALAKTKGFGWIDYRMTNPATHKIGLKTSWVQRAGDYIVFAAAFKN